VLKRINRFHSYLHFIKVNSDIQSYGERSSNRRVLVLIRIDWAHCRHYKIQRRKFCRELCRTRPCSRPGPRVDFSRFIVKNFDFVTITREEARFAHQNYYDGEFEVVLMTRCGPFDFFPFSLFHGASDIGSWHGLISTDGKVFIPRKPPLPLTMQAVFRLRALWTLGLMSMA